MYNRQEGLKIFTPPKVRERIYNYKLSKVNALRKGKSGLESGRSLSNFSLAEDNIMAILVNTYIL